MTVTPGNSKSEILRVLPRLAPHFDEVVLLGYLPFLKNVIDSDTDQRIPRSDHDIKLVFAGEVFSERWRKIVATRACADLARGTALPHGTADAEVLAVEALVSIAARRFFAERPELARREVFGDARLPTILQYEPSGRYFETHEGSTLLFSCDGGGRWLDITSPSKAGSSATGRCSRCAPDTASTLSKRPGHGW